MVDLQVQTTVGIFANVCCTIRGQVVDRFGLRARLFSSRKIVAVGLLVRVNRVFGELPVILPTFAMYL
jgi:hypothetical protein